MDSPKEGKIYNTFFDLTDDCLNYIAKNLNLKDQVRLSMVSERMEPLFADYWGNQRQFQFLVIQGRDYGIRVRDFAYILSVIAHKIISINANHGELNKLLNISLNLEFTALNKLIITNGDINFNKSCFANFGKRFPNLKQLQLYGSTLCAVDCAALRQLEALTLHFCELSPMTLQRICNNVYLKKLDFRGYVTGGPKTLLLSQRKSKNIRELTVPQYLLLASIDDICSLEKLSVIKIYEPLAYVDAGGFGKLRAAFGSNVFCIGVTRMNSFVPVSKSLSELCTLRQLVFFNVCVWFVPVLPELQKLTLHMCWGVSTENLLNIFLHCPKLDFLDLMGTRAFDTVFLRRAAATLRSKECQIKTPLEINITNSSLEIPDHMIEYSLPEIRERELMSDVITLTTRIKMPPINEFSVFTACNPLYGFKLKRN